MTDEHVEELASAFVDGELTPEENRRLFAHLGGCTSCQDFVKSLLRIRDAVRAVSSAEVPIAVGDNVFNRISIREEKAARGIPPAPARHASRWRTRFVVSAPAAAIVAIMIALWSIALSSIFLTREKQAAPPATYYQSRGEYPPPFYGSSDPRWQN